MAHNLDPKILLVYIFFREASPSMPSLQFTQAGSYSL